MPRLENTEPCCASSSSSPIWAAKPAGRWPYAHGCPAKPSRRFRPSRTPCRRWSWRTSLELDAYPSPQRTGSRQPINRTTRCAPAMPRPPASSSSALNRARRKLAMGRCTGAGCSRACSRHAGRQSRPTPACWPTVGWRLRCRGQQMTATCTGWCGKQCTTAACRWLPIRIFWLRSRDWCRSTFPAATPSPSCRACCSRLVRG